MFHASRHAVRRLMPPFWRRAPALLGLFVGIDLRRPASWIALAMGGWLGWWWAAATADQPGWIVMLSAAVLAVAAIGDVPLAVCVPPVRGLPLVWCCERAAWPLVGMMLGMLAAGGGMPSFESVTVAMVGALLATVTTVASRLFGAKAADAASLTLLLAAASAAAGGELASRFGGNAAAVAAWLLLGGLGWAWSRSQRAAIEMVFPGGNQAGHAVGADVLHVDTFPANGPLRQTLTGLAMVAALVAMAVWLMFEPAIDPAGGGGLGHVGQHGPWDRMVQVHRTAVAWALFTAAWFVGLAIPQATLQDGVAGSVQWERLFRTAARVRHVGASESFGSWCLRPGAGRFAGGVALTQAAILGWPVLVCAVLSLPTAAAARLPLGIVIGLVASAVVVWGVVVLGAAVRASRETTFATALAIALAIVGIGLAFATDSTLPVPPSVQPAQPNLPSLVPPPLQHLRGG